MKLLITTQKVNSDDDVLGFFCQWIAEFAKHFDNVIVLCLEEGKHDLPDNVQVYSLGKDKGQPKWRWVINFYKHIYGKRDQYDVVFNHMNSEYVVVGGLPWKLMSKRMVLWHTHKCVPWTLRFAEKFVSIICTGSNASLRLPTPKKRIMGQGIDTDYFAPQPDKNYNPETFSLFSIGRMSASKGHDIALAATKILHEKGIPVTLKVVGSPVTEDDEVYNEQVTKDIEATPYATLHAGLPHEQVRDELLQTDIFIHPSSTGSADKMGYETMACAVPIISSNQTFVDLFEEENFPELIVRDRTPEKFADKIEAMIKRSPTERADLGKRLRAVSVRDHSLPGLIERVTKLLKAS